MLSENVFNPFMLILFSSIFLNRTPIRYTFAFIKFTGFVTHTRMSISERHPSIEIGEAIHKQGQSAQHFILLGKCVLPKILEFFP